MPAFSFLRYLKTSLVLSPLTSLFFMSYHRDKCHIKTYQCLVQRPDHRNDGSRGVTNGIKDAEERRGTQIERTGKVTPWLSWQNDATSSSVPGSWPPNWY
jgi:hypothetical protein